MKNSPTNFIEKQSEMKYHDVFVETYGCYEMYPDEEYIRILSESGILNAPPSLVLDVGCGSGAFASRLAKHGFTVVGIDISPASIRTAKRLAKKQGSNADFVVGNIEMMPFRKASFPLIFCGCVLHHLPAKTESIIHGINRILSNTGRLSICEPNAFNPGCFVNYHFGTNRTANERALNPKKIKKVLLSEGFLDVTFVDIGDLKISFTVKASALRKIVRRALSITLAILNKLPFSAWTLLCYFSK
jgi:ubiquinone/menaquinone biosynthesis C-methylase UbiE